MIKIKQFNVLINFVFHDVFNTFNNRYVFDIMEFLKFFRVIFSILTVIKLLFLSERDVVPC